MSRGGTERRGCRYADDVTGMGTRPEKDTDGEIQVREDKVSGWEVSRISIARAARSGRRYTQEKEMLWFGAGV